MAEKETPAAENAAPAAAATGLRRLSMTHWLMIIVGTSVVAHGVLLFGWRTAGSRPAAQLTTEIPLGEFQFVNAAHEPDQEGIAGAKFELHVDLLSGVSQAAGAQLQLRKHRVQQDIEELLRQAHVADFEDPTLTELKRQLKEKINATIEMRAVQEVIITHLQLDGSRPKISSAGVAIGHGTESGLVPDTLGRLPGDHDPAG